MGGVQLSPKGMPTLAYSPGRPNLVGGTILEEWGERLSEGGVRAGVGTVLEIRSRTWALARIDPRLSSSYGGYQHKEVSIRG